MVVFPHINWSILSLYFQVKNNILFDHIYVSFYSVKWVGLFVILLVGLMTIKDLWDLLGDLTISMVVYSIHIDY